MITAIEHRIILAGYGGQGIVLAGNLLARAAIAENKFVTGMVAYGAEMRGGTANASVVISDEEIASPVVEEANMAIFLNQPSLERFEEIMMPGSIILLNSSLVSHPASRGDVKTATVEATSIAEAMGSIKVANIVALGAFVKITSILKIESVVAAVDELFAEKNAVMAELNRQALFKGAEAVASGKCI
jgi:2-oxoglutarate ferredoxin oxidoreductase subunit gamma